jgi:hypothetical protein
MVNPVPALAALSIILLHRADGGEVTVYPGHITSLHEKQSPGAEKNKLLTHEARCVLWLDDGKLLAVLETCDVVKQLLEKATGK